MRWFVCLKAICCKYHLNFSCLLYSFNIILMIDCYISSIIYLIYRRYSMATYTGSASWFCCYPDPCNCDDCCCQGSNCSTPCGQGSACGPGGCCTCRSGDYGIAWKTNCSWCCDASNYPSISCGEYVFINPGTFARAAKRVDTGPSTCVMVDCTKALFSSMAPLHQGIIPQVTVQYPI